MPGQRLDIAGKNDLVLKHVLYVAYYVLHLERDLLKFSKIGVLVKVLILFKQHVVAPTIHNIVIVAMRWS
jgi:hypothetical protein